MPAFLRNGMQAEKNSSTVKEWHVQYGTIIEL